MDENRPLLTRRFDVALQLASALHHRQHRKGTRIPYIAHLMAVSAIVLEAGGDEELAIAALFHDAVEDQGGAATEKTIRRLFGDRVADIVAECSDTDIEPKPPWRERKEAYLAHLKTASDDALLVSAADKLHNARAILADYRLLGDDLWERFNASKTDQLWYYRQLVRAFRARGSTALVEEFDRVVSEIEQLAGKKNDGR
jgi:(p)ppGpp synthase/HD superfamily hydrolase